MQNTNLERGESAVPPLPTKEQLEWADQEIGVIIHQDLQVYDPGFDPRSGEKLPRPDVFNPVALDTDQWLRTARSAGAKYAILVAKHWSGFSLWPTEAHDYSVKSSPWRNGKGDIVADFIRSCEKFGIRPGLYCSASGNARFKVDNPGRVRSGDAAEQDRYNRMVETQLTELWTRYGKLFEVWFDGGVMLPEEGGPDVIPLLRKYQPDALVLGGPEGCPNRLRTIGNERGEAPRPCWNTIDHGTSEDGTIENPFLGGSPDGRLWIPGESDMPNRDQNLAFQAGWFWRAGDDRYLYSLDHLTERYFSSVGRNTNLLLGMVIDNRGLVPEVDRVRFAEFGARVRELQSRKLASAAGNGTLELTLPPDATVGMISLMEEIAQGERVRRFAVEAELDGKWTVIWRGTNIGHKQLERFSGLKPTKLRLTVEESAGTPAIREFAAWDLSGIPFSAPPDMAHRARLSILRDGSGMVEIRCDNPDLLIRYTSDGSEPDEDSPLYEQPFALRNGGTVKAYAFVNSASRSAVATTVFGCDRSRWNVQVSLESPYANGGFAGCRHLLDDDPDTYWHTYHCDKQRSAPPQEAILELDSEQTLSALTLMPRATGGKGIAAPDEYEFKLSCDGVTWESVAAGRFPDIKERPDMQLVRLPRPHRARFIRFIGKHAVDGADYLVVAGIGAVVSEKSPKRE